MKILYENETFHILSLSLILSVPHAEETAEERVKIVGATLQGQQAARACRHGPPSDTQSYKTILVF